MNLKEKYSLKRTLLTEDKLYINEGIKSWLRDMNPFGNKVNLDDAGKAVKKKVKTWGDLEKYMELTILQKTDFDELLKTTDLDAMTIFSIKLLKNIVAMVYKESPVAKVIEIGGIVKDGVDALMAMGDIDRDEADTVGQNSDLLQAMSLDSDYSQIIDNKLELAILKAYLHHVKYEMNNNPDDLIPEDDTSFTKFVEEFLADNIGEQASSTVVGGNKGGKLTDIVLVEPKNPKLHSMVNKLRKQLINSAEFF